MKEIILRDNLSRVIGVITIDNRGIQTLRTQLGEVLGTYDPNSNLTRTFLGQIVGSGNLLTMLIKP